MQEDEDPKEDGLKECFMKEGQDPCQPHQVALEKDSFW